MSTQGIKIVCLVGSWWFRAKFCEIGERLEKGGVLVLTMTFWQHADGCKITQQERDILFRVDNARIDLADEVWVVNGTRRWCPRCNQWKDYSRYQTGSGMGWHVCPNFDCENQRLESRPYVGENTQREIDYAIERFKSVRWLNPPHQAASPFVWSNTLSGGTAMEERQEQKNAALRKQYVNHTPGQKAKNSIESLREDVNCLHDAIEAQVPSCRERSLALTKLEECLMWAVKGIVLNDPDATPCQPVDLVQ